MKTSDFYYDLPQEQIAQTPLEPRDSSRLLVYNRKTDQIQHKIFRDIESYLTENDVLVVNNTRVIPARIFGYKPTGAKIELLLLKKLELNTYEALLKPAKKAPVGTILHFSEELSAEIVSDVEEIGGRVVKFIVKQGTLEEQLDKLGEMPLPPYIREKLKDQNRYQTVYSSVDGSSAAPTAGLHFTNELLDKLKNKGVQIAQVTLDVGLGTFRPVMVENVETHNMHSEYYEIDVDTCNTINETKQRGNKVICVGTTSCRVLESASDENGILTPKKENTNIFIYPGYTFKVVDNLITNFHLPESTLIMLVSALAGKENILNAYNTAVEEKYRFFSFGDAMYIKET